jgi:hypothetical protein
VRFRPAGFTGTPKPKDEPMAADPPAGAYIDYTLATAARMVEIDIRDSTGALARHFSSAEAAPPLDLAKLDVAPEWIVTPGPPAAAAGQHRFVWDLRYGQPAGLPPDFRIAGVWAPPGRYEVELTVDGMTRRQGLTIVPDPRITAPAQSYRREFEMARRIENDRLRIATALREVGALSERLKTASDARAKALQARAAALADPASVGSLANLASVMRDLQIAVDGADGGPTADAVTGYALASKALTASLAAALSLRTQAGVNAPAS